MDPGSFSLDTDRRARLITLRISGFWTTDDVSDVAAGLAAECETLYRHGSATGHAILLDLTDCQVHAPPVVDAIHDAIAIQARRASRIAAIIASALLQMQMKRLVPQAKIFHTRAAALDWLRTPEA